MILITGAGGKTGRALVKALSTEESVCAFIYREEQTALLRALGAEKVVAGDMRDEAAIRFAMQDVRAIYHICPNMDPEEEAIGELVIREAQEAGVEHFLYHSVLHPQTESMIHHWHKLRVEERILASGLPFTILQPAPYMQNLLPGWRWIVEDGLLIVPYSVHVKFSFVDLEDVAEAARIVLTEPNHKYAIYELAGSLPLSHAEVAERFGPVLRRPVRAEKEEIVEWKARTAVPSSQRERYALESLVKMFEYYDQWGLAGNPNVLRWVLKREPTSWEAFIERTLHERASAD